MRLTTKDRGNQTLRSWALAAACGVVTILTIGCPNPPDDNNNGNGNGNNNGNDNTAVEAEIISPTTNFGISELEEPVSVLYTVEEDAENIQGYYVPVAGAATDSPVIGDRVVAANDLEAGERMAFNFDPGEAGVGYFRVGILFDLADQTDLSAESNSTIEVQGPPDPIFILPPDDINAVISGQTVQIAFDARDPQAIVQWRLFYFTPQDPLDNPANQLGTEIATGSGNVGNVTLLTEDLPLGDYQLGLSATDSGQSIASTVANGEFRRIVTVPSIGEITPTIRIIAAP